MKLSLNLPNEYIEVKNTSSTAKKERFNVLKDGHMGLNVCLVWRPIKSHLYC